MRIRSTASLFWIAAACASLPALGAALGCARSPVGDWYVNTFEPASACGSFASGRLTLHSDHTYAASADCGGKARTSRGSWAFDGQTLVFRDQSGSQRRYPAMLVDDTHMKMYSEILGTDVVAVFKRPRPRPAPAGEVSR